MHTTRSIWECGSFHLLMSVYSVEYAYNNNTFEGSGPFPNQESPTAFSARNLKGANRAAVPF